ncbi:hypothetical protein [Dyadobacter sandarakinus]|uniref:Uncharacterized protein n=1 Tax=Dyadobacter sandarakinus TaxID=2747268 RepID=A0ABX7I2W0_9BACT|nr:hypothetical protein [Dyadobacter sandarakinus]QRQ99886.1 hypothetical protein HWI92_02605 [Dyadobacter sandarakinus]
MTIQDRIQQDLALISQDEAMQPQLLHLLQTLKLNTTSQSNRDKVLAHAGTVGNQEAAEVAGIINDAFGGIDGEWH